ncbi:hypothetical protein ACJIZ3_019429 [Penstemon smallii]|uniref:Beta-glucosidase n=1 Tax=Penstemon smallii TaxID=265156 RepID=A0ABD3T146_9LAMI
MWLRRGILIFAFLGIQICSAQNISRRSFPKGFVFGTASSAFQYEGAVNEGGRGLTIWDTYAHTKGKIVDFSNADVADNQFSIAWSRIYPDGTGKINQAGIDYYNNLINALIANGIEPYVTLYHWDLPQSLQDKYLGWLHPLSMVKYWITFNEPHTFIIQGYDMGISAPNRCSVFLRANCSAGNSATEPYIVGHHVLLSHATVVDIYKKRYQPKQHGSIGITLDSFWYESATKSSDDIQATQRALDFNLGWSTWLYIVPYGMRSLMNYIRQKYGNPPVIITENGMDDDFVSFKDALNDEKRIIGSFPKGFVFGTASSAYQYEGAVKEDGKGPTIWDTYAHTVGKVIDSSNADVANDQKDFATYAETCFKEFGDRVKYWITFNEPRNLAVMAYDEGTYAPSRCSVFTNVKCSDGNSATEPYIVAHNQLLSHAAAVHTYKKKYQQKQRGSIGISLDSYWYEPATNSSDDIEAAQKARDFNLGDYPKSMRRIVKSRLPRFSKVQSNLLKDSFDFIGINHYTSSYASLNKTYLKSGLLNNSLSDSGAYTTRKFYVVVHFASWDKKEDGCNVKGYFVWSFLDNWEWSAGFSAKFGLYYVDYNNLKRYAKDSAKWFKKFLAS